MARVIVAAQPRASAANGALSGGGTLRATGRVDGEGVGLIWDEGTAPSGTLMPAGSGFGARLLRPTRARSLRGRFARTIDAGGLRLTMSVPAR